METKRKASLAGGTALIVALTGGITAIYGSHSTSTTNSQVPVVVNRPHDAHGSPLPVTATKLPNGAPLIIVGHGAPSECSTQDSGQLPDPSCTPGVVDRALSKADLCPHLHGTVVRNVSQATKDEVRRRYGDHNPGEIDHLISLELGGSNDIKNLWPEDGKIPNAKDAVENRLHSEVCSGQITLAKAQQEISTDWRKGS